MVMWLRFATLASVFVIFACPAEAAPQRIEIAPPTGEVGFRAYKLGLIPIDGRFTRFTGSLTFDPSDSLNPRIDLQGT